MTSMLAAALWSSTVCLAPAKAQPSDQDADEAALVRKDENGAWYVFGEDELTGDVLTPEGELVPWRRPPKFPSLITIRSHFLPELLKLAMDLK